MNAEDSTQPLSVPVFRSIWVTSIVSSLGIVIQSVGASWMMMSLTDSPMLVAFVQGASSLPVMLFSLWAGALADNVDRRRVMILAQAFAFIVACTMIVSAWSGHLGPWLLLGFTFLLGCGNAVSGPALQASVGDMVPRGALSRAITLNSMSFNIARSTGPALGGAIIAAFGAAGAFAVNAAGCFGMLAVLVRWRRPVEERDLPAERISEAMAAGLRYVVMSPAIRGTTTRALTFGLVSGAITTLLPLVSLQMHGGPMVYGVLLGSFGVGGVIGGLYAARLRDHFTAEQLIRLGSAIMAVCAIGIGLDIGIFPVMILLVLAGASWLVCLSNVSSLIQFASPAWVLARVLSLFQMAVFGGVALGSFFFGYLAARYGITVALFTSAALQAVVILQGFRAPIADSSDLDLELTKAWREPATALAITGQSGPVLLTVSYRIAEENALQFLRLMDEQRRLRVRDGARNWSITRDLADPERWVEIYRFPTWIDYVRHNHRRTKADLPHYEALEKLYLQGQPPMPARLLERRTTFLPHARQARR